MRKPRAHDVNVPFMNPLQITWGTVCFRRYSILQSIGHSTGCSIGYSARYIQLVEVFHGLEGLQSGMYQVYRWHSIRYFLGCSI